MRDNILDQLITLQYATANNFYSPRAKNPLGAVLNARKHFAFLEKQGYIRRLPLDEKPKNKMRETFYQVTAKGAHRADRRLEYRYKEYKAITNVKHESMKIDVAMSFLRGWPDWLINFDYKRSIAGKAPDIFVTMRDRDDKYCFVVEIERKRSPSRVLMETAKKWENIKFHKFGLPIMTKVLIVYAPNYFDVLIRPNQYAEIWPQVAEVKKDFERLILNAKGLSDKFLFLPFYDFDKSSQAVWHRPDGEKKMLINK
jgi:hypothetical protein